MLERYNLSDTSEDIKGIAFERFLGRTFRGEIGQFFTPRTIVEFMIRMVGPKEGDVICDPASGSGGFLIRFFEIVREQILADIDHQYKEYREEVEGRKLSEEKKAELLREKFDELQKSIKSDRKGSRLWKLANRCIYGTDANDRMARTSKMNMIMHGDGHGGVHHHDGFINVNGIFDGRFDIVLTNPPFGASVEETDVILESDVKVDEDEYARYVADYGNTYKESQARLRAAAEAIPKKPIASLFTLPKGEKSNVKTEILFIERCLSLLKPGGRLGIVLPEGIFNNPSLAYVREFCEDRAFIRAVVSLPQETFYSSGASVKASLLFMQKFTDEEQGQFDKRKKAAEEEIREHYQADLDRLMAIIQRPTLKQADFLEGIEKPTKEQKDKASQKAKDANTELKEQRAKAKKELKTLEETIRAEARALLKERFPYPIFLYEAERVGITATGEEDLNELCRYPQDKVPAGIDKTCLELNEEFRQNPESFLLKEGAE
ncbi:MAG TPA: N-6 DNA methylase [Pyrinomonadaceae bacterium]